MHGIGLKRALAGKTVLAVLALLLLVAGTTTASPLLAGGWLLAAAAHQLVPTLPAGATSVLVVVGVYVQAVVLAGAYRVATGGYRTLQERAGRTRSA